MFISRLFMLNIEVKDFTASIRFFSLSSRWQVQVCVQPMKFNYIPKTKPAIHEQALCSVLSSAKEPSSKQSSIEKFFRKLPATDPEAAQIHFFTGACSEGNGK